jgi:hypothetical protein
MTMNLMKSAAKFSHAMNTETKTAPKKKSAKPVAQKAAPITPKAKGNLDPAKAANGSEKRFDPAALITVLHKDHSFKGKRATAIGYLKTGLTVGKYRDILVEKKLGIFWGPSLRRCFARKADHDQIRKVVPPARRRGVCRRAQPFLVP